jgi:hypothetical protein
MRPSRTPWFERLIGATFRITNHGQERSEQIIASGPEIGKSVSIIPKVSATPVRENGHYWILFDSGPLQT